MDRRHHQSRTERLESKKREVAERLKRVCAGWDPAEFARLVEQIAEIDVRYAMRTPTAWDAVMVNSMVFVDGQLIGLVEAHVVSEAVPLLTGHFGIKRNDAGDFDLHLDANAAASDGGQYILARTVRRPAGAD